VDLFVEVNNFLLVSRFDGLVVSLKSLWKNSRTSPSNAELGEQFLVV